MSAKEQPDEMDLSRQDAQRRSEEEPLHCAHCGGFAGKQEVYGQAFPVRIRCTNPVCGISTPFLSYAELAVLIWNRRVARKPPAKPTSLVDSIGSIGHTRQSNARKRGSGKAAGSKRNRPKRMRKSKESSK
jgi:hypothetical protein